MQKQFSRMNRIILIYIFLFNSITFSQAQMLKGKITNQTGDPIPYSTVYIQELKQGTTSNTKGDYEIRLPAGKYTVIYKSLGFEPVFINITLSDKTIIKDVILPVQYYELSLIHI